MGKALNHRSRRHSRAPRTLCSDKMENLKPREGRAAPAAAGTWALDTGRREGPRDPIHLTACPSSLIHLEYL